MLGPLSGTYVRRDDRGCFSVVTSVKLKVGGLDIFLFKVYKFSRLDTIEQFRRDRLFMCG